MRAIAVIPAHSEDLLRINLRHLHVVWPKEWDILVVTTRPMNVGDVKNRCLSLPSPVGGARDHAAALLYARSYLARRAPRRADIVLCLDDDVVVLSVAFVATLRSVFADPHVGAWGAAGIRDTLHASCFAIRRTLWDRLPALAMHAALPAHDTLGHAQTYVRSSGFQCVAVSGVRVEGGWDVYGNGLWAHLGGGTVYAPQTGWRQGLRRVRATLGNHAAREILAGQVRRQRWIETYGPVR